MLKKVFFLGRPGSGKSTAARYMIELAQRRNYSTFYMKDYDILYHMFLKDRARDRSQQQFRPADYDGFDVLDTILFDTALKKLEANILAIPDAEKLQMVVIEFARDDYRHALQLFEPEFLHDSYIFFVDADLQVCINRIHKRVETPSEPDHHFVSDYIMQTYYNKDNWMYVSSLLKEEYPFFKHVEFIRNTELLPDLLAQVGNFADIVFQNEVNQQKQPEELNADLHNNNELTSARKQKNHVKESSERTDRRASVTPRPSSSTSYMQYTGELQNGPVALAP